VCEAPLCCELTEEEMKTVGLGQTTLHLVPVLLCSRSVLVKPPSDKV